MKYFVVLILELWVVMRVGVMWVEMFKMFSNKKGLIEWRLL